MRSKIVERCTGARIECGLRRGAFAEPVAGVIERKEREAKFAKERVVLSEFSNVVPIAVNEKYRAVGGAAMEDPIKIEAALVAEAYPFEIKTCQTSVVYRIRLEGKFVFNQ